MPARNSSSHFCEACPGLTLMTTSREPIGLAGEVTWRVPSLSLSDEAVELFEDRARRVRPNFTVTDDDAATVTEICRRLDGMPLAIEFAAARVRALSLTEILDSLHDRFRLLTGGSRRAVRRQQSLGASVDWSHALLTEPERILFRRLSAFMGGFDLDAAQDVCSGGALPRHQILDQLTLLVDKSLVVAETASGRTRYRLLETIRQYATGEARRIGRSRCSPRFAPRSLHVDGRRIRRPDRPLVSKVSSVKPRSRSTTYAQRSRGAPSTKRSNVHCNSCVPSSRCGPCDAACRRAWPGSMRRSPMRPSWMSRPQCVRGRWPTK